VLAAYRLVRGGPESLRDPIGVELIGVRRTPTWRPSMPCCRCPAVVRFHISLASFDRSLPYVWLIGAAAAAVAPAVDRHFSTAKAPSAPET
jgi:hypothetical protein